VFSATSYSSSASRPTVVSFQISTLAPVANSTQPYDTEYVIPPRTQRLCAFQLDFHTRNDVWWRRSFDVVFALFEGDWFDAAQIYRRAPAPPPLNHPSSCSSPPSQSATELGASLMLPGPKKAISTNAKTHLHGCSTSAHGLIATGSLSTFSTSAAETLMSLLLACLILLPV
jgi:hypothetical protein